jgi:S1-C subfamily serine protease
MITLCILLLACGEIEKVPSADFSAEAQAAAVAGTVRVVNAAAGAQGSGAIIGKDGPYLYVLTANHLTDKAERLEIHTFSAASFPKAEGVYRGAQVLARAANEDLALLRLVTRDAPPGSIRVCPPRLVPDAGDFPALAVGCGEGGAPTCRIEKVAGKKRVRKEGQEGTALYWEVGREAARGRSGGPLIDRRGRLVGVGSFNGDGKNYFSHAAEIHTFLRNNGLKSLYEEDGGR